MAYYNTSISCAIVSFEPANSIVLTEKSNKNRQKLRKELSSWKVRLINTSDDDESATFVVHDRERTKYTAQLRLSYGRKLNQKLPEELSMFINKQVEDEGCLQYEELITADEKKCFIRGVAGIGKTCLLEYIALKWARKELFQDDDGNDLFDFLFLIKCRELEEEKNETIQEFILRRFDVDTERLEDHGNRVLIIVDGLDEDTKLEKSLDNDSSKLSMLLCHKSKFLKGHATIISGRPHIESTLNEFEKITGEYRRIEVTGLSQKAVDEHIDVIADKNEEMAQKIKDAIKSSTNMSALASIPQYLETLCCVIAIKGKDETAIHTMTPLYVWILTSFWIQHVQSQGSKKKGAYEIFEDENVVNFITKLSSISFQLLKDDKIVFKKQEIPLIEKVAEQYPEMFSTFFTKLARHRKPLYQFKHLTLHEFFVAIHCMLSGLEIQEILKKGWYEVARFIGGFTAAKELADDDDIVYAYIDCLENGLQKTARHKDINGRNETEMESFFNSVLDFLEHLPKGKGEFAQHYALSLFHEMFKPGSKISGVNIDVIPRFQKVVGDPAFIFYSMTQMQLSSVVHFIELLKSNQMQHSLNEVTLRIRFATLTHKKTLEELFMSLLSFKNVWFTYCEFSDYPWKKSCYAPEESKLDHLYLNKCEMTENETKQLAHLIPFAEKVELIDLALSNKSLTELFEAIKEEHAKGRSRLRELKMNYCKVNGDFKKKFMSLKHVDVYIIK